MSDEDKQKPEPAKNILSVLVDDDAKSLGKEYFEAGLDALFDSDIVDRLPVVNSVFTVGKLFRTLREALYARKVINFINGLEGDQEKWKVFTEKLIENNGSADKAGEVLIHHLERLDDIKKAHISGLLYSAAADGRISVDELYRFCMWVDRIYLPDLELLIKLDPLKISNSPGLETFSMLDIVYVTTLAPGSVDAPMETSSANVYAMTEPGKKFISIVSESRQFK